MIIKSMSRKSATFSQLIDYMEAGASSHRFSVFHNTYSRQRDDLKNEFQSNSEHLRRRKNGVYLYHEILSITRAAHQDTAQQKEALRQIVSEYLKARAGKNLAYAVLHEDKKDNLHFHILISANTAGHTERTRLSKQQFSDIQTRLEAWVLSTYPELEQTAVFAKNQSQAQQTETGRKERRTQQGEALKRRTGTTPKRDQIKATLADIFETALDGADFTRLLTKAGLIFYQRGKNHGVTAEDGTKYRFSTLGLMDEWEALDSRMVEVMHQGRTNHTEQNTPAPKQQEKAEPEETKSEAKHTQHKSQPPEEQRNTPRTDSSDHQHAPRDDRQARKNTPEDQQQAEIDPIEAEMNRRMEEMKALRAKQKTEQTSTSQKQKP